MKYTVEELSPVKKKVQVEVPAAEVDAVLNQSVNRYRASVALPGFRKGKAPMGMVEKRFAQDIYKEATESLLQENIGEVLKELDMEPIAGLNLDGAEEPLKRGSDYSYAFIFEVMPTFDLPEYNGIAVEEEKAVVTDEEIDSVIDRVRRNMGTREEVTEKRLPAEGDVVSMDFEGTDEEGNVLDGVSGKNFQVTIGEKQVIPDFEALVLTIMPGETKEGDVVFPEDYHSANLAGKTVRMKITVNSLATMKLPEINDDFAKLLGAFESVDDMRENIRNSYMNNRKELSKSKAQSLLLEGLLEKVEFPLPEGLVDRYTGNILADRFGRMQRGGLDMNELDKETVDGWREEAKTEAEKYARTQIFLLSIAKKEAFEVSPQEMEAALRQIAAQGNHDFNTLYEHYVRNNLLGSLRDRLLADKAMDFIYEKAEIKEVEPTTDADENK
ncbi:trigger factor [Desulfovibrio sp. OttesenSCG-928-I05]|nr:trigger factor [Desulfovibrio sp. OttesenSCG-928-I05]